MLILHREPKNTGKTAIYIGNNIKISILRIKKGQVRVGIIAPKNMRIVREEILPDSEKFDFNLEEQELNEKLPD